MDPEVLAVMQPWWNENFGNPHSSEHWFGWEAHQAVEVAREAVASLIGAASDEVLFVSGATEANNLALIGGARARHSTRSHILVSAIEHKCVLESAFWLKSQGWHVDVIPVDQDGFVRLDALVQLLSDDTAILSVMAVNNEIGTIQPLETIGKLCAELDVWFHCDAAQAAAALSIDVWDSHIDLLSLSSHKFYGPKGIGALFARSDVLAQLRPMTYGGGQEQGVRSGTLPTPLCVGFGEAAKIMARQRKTEGARMEGLRDRLRIGIQNHVPRAFLNGPENHRHPGNLNVCIPGYDTSVLLGKLQPTLAASTGSACTTGMPEPSHVLQAVGLSPAHAESSLRLGLGRFTRPDEIENAIRLITTTLDRMAEVLPQANYH